jgi:hypothetical protein
MGMTGVACFIVGVLMLFVRMTSTLSLTNSAATSAMRSRRPSDQRYSIATVRSSIQPSSRSRATKTAVHERQTDASPPSSPIVGNLPACCARAASGHAATPLPSRAMNCRRLMGFLPAPTTIP